MIRSSLLFYFLLVLGLVLGSSLIEVDDTKELKKLLKGNPSVLMLFTRNKKELTWFSEFDKAADRLKGKGKLAFVDCEKNKRVCLGKLDKEESYVLKYYLQGKEAKEYPSGRPLKALSFYNFVLNPNGEASWEELDTAPDVIHVDDNNIERVLAENKPTLVFFYAPNCVHCELFKPAYSAVATTLKGKANLCAVDASSPNSVRSVYKHKLTGFPAVKYFDKGIFQFDYGGERTEKGLIDWLKNPTAPVPPKPEPSWNDTPNDLNHLTDTSFDEFMNDHPVTLVIFYAPWCGHCKNARPFLEQAATTLKDNKSVAAIAAVDCTKETLLATRFEIKGYPTIKYFQNGEYLEDYIGKRTKDDFLQYLDTKMIQFQEAKQEL